MAVFVGREPELEMLARWWEQASAAAARFVLVEGPSGIGKSALVDRFASLAPAGTVVIRATGVEAEGHFPFGVAEQLWPAAGRPVPETLRQRSVLDPVTLGGDLVTLLGDLEQTGPVLVIVDDGHWSDTASLHALVFAQRRLQADAVLTVVVSRSGEDVVLPDSVRRLAASGAGGHLMVRGLDSRGVQQMAASLGRGVISAASATRLVAHTAGNALHLVTLLEELPPDAVADTRHRLPAVPSVSSAVADRMAASSEPGRRLVEAVAVLGEVPLARAAALASLADPLAALDDAVDCRLLHFSDAGSALSFDHPMVRAAVLAATPPGRRRALHLRAALDSPDPAEALGHRLAGATGPDPDLAAEVVDLARQESTTAQWAAAAATLLAAARLAASPAQAEPLVLEAADYLLMDGEIAGASGLLARTPAAGSPWRSYLQGRLATMEGRIPEAITLLEESWAHPATPADTHLHRRVAAHLALGHLLAGHWSETAEWAALASDLTDDLWSRFALVPRLLGLALSGRREGVEAVVKEVAALVPGPQQVPFLPLGRGLVRIWEDDLDGARADLELAGSAPYSPHRLLALGFLSHVEFLAGQWEQALLHAEKASWLGEDSDLVWGLSAMHGLAVLPLVERGQWDAATRHVAGARAHAHRDGVFGEAAAGMAAITLAVATGSFADAVEAGEPLLRLTGLDNAAEPGVFGWRAPLAEALVGLRRFGEAGQVLAPMEEAARSWGRLSLAMAAARVRGVILMAGGDAAGAADGLEQALVADAPFPFEVARLRFTLGSARRRAGRRREAAGDLEAALASFRTLGAGPWIDRAERELAGLGGAPSRAPGRDRGRLTAQEEIVAHLGAAGRSNAGIAAELVLSVKTVEFHLANVYAKLGIRRRGDLRAALDTRGIGRPR